MIKNSTSIRRTALLGALMMSAAAPTLAWAQAAASADVGVQEVVVTAQRRTESLQKVPVAVTVVSGDHEVDCKTEAGNMLLKACFLKKA